MPQEPEPLSESQIESLRRLYARRSELSVPQRAQVEQLAAANGIQNLGEQLGIEPAEPVINQSRQEQTTERIRGLLGGAAPYVLDPVLGAAKGVGSTAFGIRNILERATGNEPSERPDFLDPQTTGEQVGFTGEQVGEFFLPAAMTSRIPALGRVLAQTGKAGLGTRAAVEGGGSGLVSLMQSGGDVSAAGLDAAIDTAFTTAFGGLGALMRRGSTRAMTSALQPSATDFKHGFEAENIFKHDLQGTIPQMVKKTEARLIELSGQLNTAIKQHGDTFFNPATLLDEAVKEVQAGGARMFGKLSDLNLAKAKLLEELEALKDIGIVNPDGTMGLVGLQQLKQATGEMGAWAEGMRDLDLRALENLANAYFKKLRESVEIAAPEVHNINKALSEIIPINGALIRRLPTFEKRRLFELGDLVVISGGMAGVLGGGGFGSTATGVSGLLLLSRMTHSATGARLFRAGGRQAESVGRGLGRTAAGITGTPTGEALLPTRNIPQQ